MERTVWRMVLGIVLVFVAISCIVLAEEVVKNEAAMLMWGAAIYLLYEGCRLLYVQGKQTCIGQPIKGDDSMDLSGKFMGLAELSIGDEKRLAVLKEDNGEYLLVEFENYKLYNVDDSPQGKLPSVFVITPRTDDKEGSWISGTDNPKSK
jgi:hypothetical protein